MPLIVIGLTGVVLLTAGYRVYGRFVARVFGLDPARRTPAHEFADGVDFIPTRPVILLGQHFAAIAAVGPIAGPILAGTKYGWLLSFVWIIFGAIFVGAVHDFSALMASVRHKARSIAEIVGVYMNAWTQKIFLVYIWISLIYVIIVFADLTAAAFASRPQMGAENFGPGVATSSLLYLILAVGLGIWMYRYGAPLLPVTVVGVIFLLILIVLGQKLPIHLGQKSWGAIILGYCFIASVIPLWILLQPRGYLGGFILYASLLAGALGFVFYREPVSSPAFSADLRWEVFPLGAGVFPLLFTTIACGACSGFHGLVAAGTTARQLDRETDARLVGYGGMLLEGFVALVALATVILFVSKGGGGAAPDEIYARGLATFLQIVGIPFAIGVSFAKLAFATFIYDTLDVATRLGRYIFQELTGWTGRAGKYAGTFLTIAVPAAVLLGQPEGGVPAWKSYWPLFGTSNQLLACLTLAAITLWLSHERRAWWVTGIPCVFMGLVTLGSLWAINAKWLRSAETVSPIHAASLGLAVLAAVFLGSTLFYLLKELKALKTRPADPAV